MQNTIKKSDFVLSPFMKSNDLKAAFQIANTLLPYIFLWFLAVKAIAISFWLLPPIILLLVLFSLRCFSLMHDCGHYSLFTSRKVNRIVGFILGLVNAIPQYWWSRDHAFHHKTNGDWERYRSIGDFLSTDEFANLKPTEQKLYEVLRHPLMIFPGGFFYLAFKPRLILLGEAVRFAQHLIQSWKNDAGLSLSKIVDSYQPENWSTAEEFWDVLLNNIFVLCGWILLCLWLGPVFFLGTYSAVLTLSAAVFICVFFVQHNFEEAYAHKTANWDYLRGAIEGSSYLDIPAVLKWFTADISYHSIHHLSEKIPNYNLKACHEANRHLLTQVRTIKISEMLACSKFILWDAQSDRLVSIATFRQQTATSRHFA